MNRLPPGPLGGLAFLDPEYPDDFFRDHRSIGILIPCRRATSIAFS